jgi:lysozyme
MITSEKGKNLIKNFEGLRLKGYLPTPNDVPTIGWGSTRIFGRPVVLGESISMEQAEEQLTIDLQKFESAVRRLVKSPLKQNQFDALVSFTYNVGEGNLKSSTLLKLLNVGDYNGAAAQFLRWDKQAGKPLPGLTKRRRAESLLFVEREEDV